MNEVIPKILLEDEKNFPEKTWKVMGETDNERVLVFEWGAGMLMSENYSPWS